MPDQDINSKLAALGLKVDVLPIESLTFYKSNNKKHGAKDLAAIYTSIEQFGFADVIICDKDLEIIAGHGRVMAAKEKGITELPVLICERLDKTQAKAYRISHNRTANIAKYNNDIMVEELRDIKYATAEGQYDDFSYDKFKDSLQLDKWTKDLDVPVFNLEEYEVKDAEEIKKEDVPDCIFPSDNPWDVPTLNIKMQADFLDAPVVQWGDVSRSAVQRGTFHFYTDDSKFVSLWNDPTGPLHTKIITLIEPNFSTGPTFPRGKALGLIHEKRWLSRYWQEYGKRIIADINIDARLYDIAILGVPKGWRAWATRGQPHILHTLYQQHQVACDVAGSDDLLFVVYAGGSSIQEVCKKEGWIWVEDRAVQDRKSWTAKMNKEMQEKTIIKMPKKELKGGEK